VIELLPVAGLPELAPGDDLAALLAKHAELRGGDILVVAQKAVSKVEGRLVRLSEVRPGPRALELAARLPGADARHVQVVLDESVRIVRAERVIISETRHGFVCANAGVDHSNLPDPDLLCLLPDDPDASAARLRDRLRELAGAEVGVIVSDTFGRAWRMGIVNVALGVAGIPAALDLRGRPDDFGRELTATVIAIADELAAAAELVMGKTDRVPAVIVRGYSPAAPPGSGRELVRPAELDLFR
jgi:coenzyme F420-0:L-glutamate ligase / coenzyme F420-1:gamma-L-glutamate ligase